MSAACLKYLFKVTDPSFSALFQLLSGGFDIATFTSPGPCQSSVDYGNTKTPSMHPRLGSTTATAGFPWGKQPGFPMEEIPMGQHSYI